MASRYSNAQIMFNESIVRAGVIRYLLVTDGPAAARTETQLQRGLGFVWMDELVDLLGSYEADRTRYPTFSAFAPRIVAYYNDLAGRITRVRAAYESHRPTIIRTSIANRDADVDPEVQKLILTFSKPVSTSVVFRGKFGDRIPEMTGGSFDQTHTVLTIGIRLKPGMEYAIPFGPGFISDDGYTNQPLDLTFRTKASPRPSRGGMR